MPRDPDAPSIEVLSFATVGGLLFVTSLVVAAVSYAGRFGADAGPWSWRTGVVPAVTDVGLFTLFALHHSLFARSGVKSWIHRVAPRVLERSIYVWAASLLLLAMCALWQAVPGSLWRIGGIAGLALVALQVVGVVLTLISSHRLDNLALAGMRQVMKTTAPKAVTLNDRGPFGIVRHPIYLGWFLMVWATPAMNGTRLVFAVVSCLYLVAAIPFEERDLRRTFGAQYDTYSQRVRWKVIPFVY